MNNLEIKVEKKLDSKELQELVEEGKKVTEEKIEDSLNYEKLSQEEKDAIEEFNKKIDVNDASQILQFGVPAQEKISKFSDSILEDVKTKNTGNKLPNLNVNEWKEFKIKELFKIERGTITSLNKIDDGEVPIVSATDKNQGIAFYGNVEAKYNNCLTASFNGVGTGFVC